MKPNYDELENVISAFIELISKGVGIEPSMQLAKPDVQIENFKYALKIRSGAKSFIAAYNNLSDETKVDFAFRFLAELEKRFVKTGGG